MELSQAQQEPAKDFEKLINGLSIVITNAILEYLINHQISPAELYQYNQTRLASLGDWIQERLASLPNTTE